MPLSSEGTSALALLGLGALIAQYVVRRAQSFASVRPSRNTAHLFAQILMYACTTTYIEMGACIPSKLGGFSGAKLGWRTGVCTTEEIVWCEANGGQHPDCATAYCRAEEIRLSLDNGKLGDYNGEPVYPCPELDRLQQFVDDMAARDHGNHRYACVPRGDKRARTVKRAAQRGACGRAVPILTVALLLGWTQAILLPAAVRCLTGGRRGRILHQQISGLRTLSLWDVGARRVLRGAWCPRGITHAHSVREVPSQLYTWTWTWHA